MRSALTTSLAAMALSLLFLPTSAHAARAIPTAGSWNRHSGYSWTKGAWDIDARCGAPVRAAATSRVLYVRHLTSSYGVHIRTGNALYAHLSREFVRSGQLVHRGQLIGRVGRSGNATGCHLHFELR